MSGRKPTVSRERAESIAARYIASLDLRGWRYEVVEVKRVPADPANWTIIVDRFSPAGNLVDGPQVLIVDGQTGDAETLESRFG